ncbi:hypothetical protein AKJ47_00135 [candidate division MSBL1 archaeon SCGC-AAA261G05]|uniref:DUF357 domain-containing protein n=3 Tax=candidate division MSBL1 TaxID=215777 RepID=A0A133V0P8_9EURY|nr:hypothetical protein AKJ42_02035 [candidate division MSBL1 archaeon SCGC-AAA261C02]KXB04250.1 hypothetical protein AKJ47_00135 [candidate division MSBL1 archaeon SCGC-AAA261G05]KXB05114.1 hypothetical protein AKJ48_00160 [candidate division MSBL1 archaeon SCGC-AAA261O19]
MLSDELQQEIERWTRKLDEKLPRLVARNGPGKEILENARAYRGDSQHFLQDDDLIKSFESLIWAWALIETGENLGHLKPSSSS